MPRPSPSSTAAIRASRSRSASATRSCSSRSSIRGAGPGARHHAVAAPGPRGRGAGERGVGRVVANDHQLAERRRITIADLANVPMIMFSEGYDLRVGNLGRVLRGREYHHRRDGRCRNGSVLSFVSAGLAQPSCRAFRVGHAGDADTAPALADPRAPNQVGAPTRPRRFTRSGRALARDHQPPARRGLAQEALALSREPGRRRTVRSLRPDGCLPRARSAASRPRWPR